MAPQTVVVLGGGVGGQVAATRLKQRLGARACVLIVERSASYTFSRGPSSFTRAQHDQAEEVAASSHLRASSRRASGTQSPGK